MKTTRASCRSCGGWGGVERDDGSWDWCKVCKGKGTAKRTLTRLDRGEVVPVVEARLDALAGKRIEGLLAGYTTSATGELVRVIALDDRAPPREDA